VDFTKGAGLLSANGMRGGERRKKLRHGRGGVAGGEKSCDTAGGVVRSARRGVGASGGLALPFAGWVLSRGGGARRVVRCWAIKKRGLASL